MEDKTEFMEEAQRSQGPGRTGPGNAAGGTIPGDAREGTKAGPAHDQPVPSQSEEAALSEEQMLEEMEEREAVLGEQRAGVLGKDVHVHTPAGGSITSAPIDSKHWGTPREDQEDT